MNKNDIRKHYDSIASRYDDRSNKYCNARYLEEIKQYTHQNDVVVELGSGSGTLLSQLQTKTRIGCELSLIFSKSAKYPDIHLVQGDAEAVPFKSNCADIVYHINLLEHVTDPGCVIREGMRLLKFGGRQIIITPNGDLSFLLEVAEKLQLKIPEGPHRFLKTRELKEIIMDIEARILKHNKIIAFPFGTPSLQALGESMTSLIKTGLFHLIILEKSLAC